MSGVINLEDLHDATLMQISIDWRRASCEITFSVVSGEQRVLSMVCLGVSQVELNHKAPWGQSVSVNRAEIKNAKTTATLEIEMQSGDTIRVECVSIDAAA